MGGYKVIAGLERRNGRHWLFDTDFTAISPGLETNDIGRTQTADGLRHTFTVRYRETQPGSNVVVRWEWKPGSTLYLVWQQDHERRDTIADRAGLDDLFGSFAMPGRMLLAVKSSFWIPVR